jgi:hypothetical protein
MPTRKPDPFAQNATASLLKAAKDTYHQHFIEALEQAIKEVTHDRVEHFWFKNKVTIKSVDPTSKTFYDDIGTNWIQPLQKMDSWWFSWSRPYKQLSDQIQMLVNRHQHEDMQHSSRYATLVTACKDTKELINKKATASSESEANTWWSLSLFAQLKRNLFTALQSKLATTFGTKNTETVLMTASNGFKKTATQYRTDFNTASSKYRKDGELAGHCATIQHHFPELLLSDLKATTIEDAIQQKAENTLYQDQPLMTGLGRITRAVRKQNSNQALSAADIIKQLISSGDDNKSNPTASITSQNSSLSDTASATSGSSANLDTIISTALDLDARVNTTQKTTLKKLLTYLEGSSHSTQNRQAATQFLATYAGLNTNTTKTLSEIKQTAKRWSTFKETIQGFPNQPMQSPPAWLKDFILIATALDPQAVIRSQVQSREDIDSKEKMIVSELVAKKGVTSEECQYLHNVLCHPKNTPPIGLILYVAYRSKCHLDVNTLLTVSSDDTIATPPQSNPRATSPNYQSLTTTEAPVGTGPTKPPKNNTFTGLTLSTVTAGLFNRGSKSEKADYAVLEQVV